ncbi:MAG: hypothetical protein KDD25_08055, partial [Bdellovibrionales bacterium]|nr:hypothetical protein [Bdellovibrionales bacterium]
MRPLNQDEVRGLASHFQNIVGAQLQKVVSFEEGLAFCFYLKGDTRWLIVDMKKGGPIALLAESEMPKFLKKRKSPTELLLRKYFEGKHLNSVEVIEELGRVLRFYFGESREVQIILFPKAQNILVNTGEKKISWNKPKILEIKEGSDQPFTVVRTHEELAKEWLKSHLVLSPLKKETGSRKEKLFIAVDKVKANIKFMEKNTFSELIEFSEGNPDEALPESLLSPFAELELGDLRGSERVQRLYDLEKKRKTKLEASKNRLKDLQLEIESGSGEARGDYAAPKVKMFEATQSKGRSRELETGVTIYVGKSASDNLKLLRKAQAWDIWMHLQDSPSAHAIVRRPRSHKFEGDVVQKAS